MQTTCPLLLMARHYAAPIPYKSNEWKFSTTSKANWWWSTSQPRPGEHWLKWVIHAWSNSRHSLSTLTKLEQLYAVASSWKPLGSHFDYRSACHFPLHTQPGHPTWQDRAYREWLEDLSCPVKRLSKHATALILSQSGSLPVLVTGQTRLHTPLKGV